MKNGQFVIKWNQFYLFFFYSFYLSFSSAKEALIAETVEMKEIFLFWIHSWNPPNE